MNIRIKMVGQYQTNTYVQFTFFPYLQLIPLLYSGFSTLSQRPFYIPRNFHDQPYHITICLLSFPNHESVYFGVWDPW